MTPPSKKPSRQSKQPANQTMNKMRISFLWAAAVAVILSFGLPASTNAAAHKSLPRSAPEEKGVSSADLLKYVEALDEQVDGMHSVMIVRGGSVIAEGWWTPY